MKEKDTSLFEAWEDLLKPKKDTEIQKTIKAKAYEVISDIMFEFLSYKPKKAEEFKKERNQKMLSQVLGTIRLADVLLEEFKEGD